jgi:hypothetical protein
MARPEGWSYWVERPDEEPNLVWFVAVPTPEPNVPPLWAYRIYRNDGYDSVQDTWPTWVASCKGAGAAMVCARRLNDEYGRGVRQSSPPSVSGGGGADRCATGGDDGDD